MKQSSWGKRVCAVIALLLAGAVIARLMQWVLSLRDPQALADFQQWVHSLGFGGWLLLLAIQYVQIVVAFIPGGPVQIVAGALYGPLGGLATCMLGMALATATVFALVRRYGGRVVRLFVGDREQRQYRFVRDEQRLERLVVILFLIPGAPKDVLTYLFARTPIPLSRFLLLSVAARIPAALTSVLAGDSIAEGNWLRALLCFLLITAISLGGLLAHRRIMQAYAGQATKDRQIRHPRHTP